MKRPSFFRGAFFGLLTSETKLENPSSCFIRRPDLCIHTLSLTLTHDIMAAKQALVVGAGAIGLRTALELLQCDTRVALRSPVPLTHASVCSVGAGGLWMPFHCDDARVDRWALETLDELMDIAVEEEDDNTNTNKLGEVVPAVSLRQTHGGPGVAEFTKTHYPNLSSGSCAMR